MLHIGCHLSCSKGYRAMGEQALSIGADTFQFFTRNPRGGSVKPFDRQDADALNAFLAEHRFAPILAHAPYTLNACAADASIREFALPLMVGIVCGAYSSVCITGALWYVMKTKLGKKN